MRKRMNNDKVIELLESAGIKPTANRILVTSALSDCEHPVSMGEIEDSLDSLDKSSIFRVLGVLQQHDVVHAIEDGRGVVRYELCHSHGEGPDDDMHAHFFCEKCHSISCFEDIPVTVPPLPEGYKVNTVNYMIKGLCPKCSAGSDA